MDDNRNRDKIQTRMNILQKPANKRTIAESQHVLDLVKDLKFFKDREIGDEDLQEITKVLSFEKFAPGDIIINFGEQGDKFYVIIQGFVLC